jgi:hypothetical protein
MTQSQDFIVLRILGPKIWLGHNKDVPSCVLQGLGFQVGDVWEKWNAGLWDHQELLQLHVWHLDWVVTKLCLAINCSCSASTWAPPHDLGFHLDIQGSYLMVQSSQSKCNKQGRTHGLLGHGFKSHIASLLLYLLVEALTVTSTFKGREVETTPLNMKKLREFSVISLKKKKKTTDEKAHI